MTSTTKPDYWSILGISPGSDISQIKRGFRTEARRWHPDLNLNNSNAEERFKLVNEAYAVLSDPKKRKLWESNNLPDKIDHDFFSEGFPTYNEYIEVVLGIKYPDTQEHYVEQPDYSEQIDHDDYSDKDNETSSFFPARSNAQPLPVKQSGDLETFIDLTPEEALYGTSVQLELNDSTLVEVKTPQFAGDGWRLRLSGVAPGGSDHFIHLVVQTNEGLHIDGLRVFFKLELFPQDALFGCAVEVPTIDGPVTLQVPPKSSSGRLLRLKGRGLEFDDLCGDQIVEIVVVLPADLSEAELALYRRLQELSMDES